MSCTDIPSIQNRKLPTVSSGRYEMLDKAIDELPEKCRLVFLMSREEGLKTKEIAEILSVQESTVRVQMKIAIEKLVARLKPSFPNISFSLLLMFIFNVIYRSA